MSQALGFDFGMKYIGVASGQTLTKTATPLTTIRAKDGIPIWSDIDQLVDDWQPNDIVIGLPLNMDGTDQLMTKRARKFANRIKERYKNIPVHLEDERLTSWEAKQHSDIPNKNFTLINAKAAAIILQQWLEYKVE